MDGQRRLLLLLIFAGYYIPLPLRQEAATISSPKVVKGRCS
jgi:hypothetical protein